MMKPVRTAAVCLAVCATLDGRPQAPVPAAAPQPGQTGAAQPAVPPEVDQALRARVTEYYHDILDGKYRAADKFVAEDSKDAFIAMSKPRIKGFEITKIDYSDNFTKAEVVLLCPGEWHFRGQTIPVKIPIHDLWRLEDGQWLWYMVPEKNTIHMPFGTVVHKTDADAAAGENAPPPALKDPKGAARAILSLVTLDQNNVALKINRKDSAEVLIKNAMPGSIELQTQSYPEVKGFSMKLDKDKLAAGETAKLILQTEGTGVKTAPPDVKVNVIVQPTSRVLPVTVKFMIAEPEAPAPAPAAPAPTTKKKKKSKK